MKNLEIEMVEASDLHKKSSFPGNGFNYSCIKREAGQLMCSVQKTPQYWEQNASGCSEIRIEVAVFPLRPIDPVARINKEN